MRIQKHHVAQKVQLLHLGVFWFFLLNLIQRYCVFTELHETSEGLDSEIQK